jgi:purine-binding chemotaxis protein CheW
LSREHGTSTGRHGSIGEDKAKAGEDSAESWVLFLINEQIYALQLSEVERIIRSVEILPLPEAPPHVVGVINIHGSIIPVVDLRIRFGQPSRDIRVEDHFIVGRKGSVSVVLPVDAALTTVEVQNGFKPVNAEAQSRCLRGVSSLDLGVVYALDLEKVAAGSEDFADSRYNLALTEIRSA